MGFRPGPLFSEILGALEDAQLEGAIKNREEAQEFVVRRFSQGRKSKSSKKGGPPEKADPAGV
jgi:hypothetical protein